MYSVFKKQSRCFFNFKKVWHRTLRILHNDEYCISVKLHYQSNVVLKCMIFVGTLYIKYLHREIFSLF